MRTPRQTPPVPIHAISASNMLQGFEAAVQGGLAPSPADEQKVRIDGGSLNARLRAYASECAVIENANDLCCLAIRTCGGQSMLKSPPLERLCRDSRCGALMLPWTAELCLDRVGREALQEGGDSDD